LILVLHSNALTYLICWPVVIVCRQCMSVYAAQLYNALVLTSPFSMVSRCKLVSSWDLHYPVGHGGLELTTWKYKVIILTRCCLIGTVPRYLATDCVPVSEMAQRRHLRSAAGRQFVVPPKLMRPSALRASSVLGLRLWNSLSRLLRDTGHITTSFGHHSLKTFFLSEY